MYVFLKFDDLEKVISNVTVDDNCLPMVDGGTPVSPGGQHGLSVEAVQWFKSLAMEAVYIDCGSREARWCPKKVADQVATTIPDPSMHEVVMRKKQTKKGTPPRPPSLPQKPFMPESARQLFTIHPHVIDFDPNVDEMFERTETILRKMAAQKMSSEDIQREVAQLLHCHVFPAVCFVKDDVPILEGCLRRIALKIRNVERDMITRENTVTLTETSLNKQKDRIIAYEELSKDSYVRSCNRAFLDAFYVHVTKDIQTLNVSLEMIQAKVNMLKRTSEDMEKLQALKQERDGIHERLDTLMQIREAIRNFLYRPHIRQRKQKKKKEKPPEENCLHNIFLEVHETLKGLKEELKQLCYRKLHFSSMREAIEATLKVIKQDLGELQGDFSEFSVQMSTAEDTRSAWQSMQTKLALWMEDRDSALYLTHMQGCHLIQDLSRSMLSEVELASLGLEPAELGHLTVGDGGDDTQRRQSSVQSTDLDAVLNSAGYAAPSDSRGHMVEIIKEQVLKHTWDMAIKIVRLMHIDPNCSRHVNRAWLCYMPHFCHETLQAVQKVYFHYHARKVTKLHKIVSSLALGDIMDERFFADLFMNNVGRGSSSQLSDESQFEHLAHAHSVESVAAISLDLQRCSVTDLYTIANKDGARLQQRLELDSVGRFSISACADNSSDGGTGEANPDYVDINLGMLDHAISDGGMGQRNPGNINRNLGMVDHASHTLQPQNASEFTREILSSNRLSECTVAQLTELYECSSDSGASVHSDDIFDAEPGSESQTHTSVRSSQTVSSVVGLFESIVQPFHELVQKVIDCPDFFEKLKAVWHTNQFLSQKVTLHCGSSGMDSLLPMSIFAIVSLRRDLFIGYYIQLLMLIDFKPDFCVHSMYDFSLMNAYSPYVFLFERQVRSTAVSNESNA